MEVLELLVENMYLIGDAISENVWEDESLFGLELVRLPQASVSQTYLIVCFCKLLTFSGMINIHI